MLPTPSVSLAPCAACPPLVGLRPLAALLFGRFARQTAVAAFAALSALALSGAAPATTPRVYTVTRLTGPLPSIDGRLDDPCWRDQGTWMSEYIQREPHEGAPATYPTEIKLLYDNRAIYVAIRAHDPEIASRPRLTGTRDEFTGEIVGVNFDSYHDRRTGFEFDVTLGGSKIDLLLFNDGSIDLSWNAVWDAKTAIEKDGWTAEFRIPLSQLRYQRGRDLVWGLHSWRWLSPKSEESDWNLIPMDNHGMLFAFGELRGLTDLPAPRRIELAPYVVAKLRNYPAEAGNPWRDGHDVSLQGGLDAKVGLGPNLTLDLTVNPDFSQVDADPSEINLSTVETFHTERRPFFLEGKDLFSFKLDDDLVFYTRRIGNAPSLAAPATGFHDSPESNRILGAAKLTGHTPGGLTIGLLDAEVDRTVMKIADGDGTHTLTVEPQTNDSVLRLQQDFAGGNSRVGLIASSSLRTGSETELQTLPRRALVYGGDALQYFGGRNYLVEGRILGTTIEGSPAAITALMESPVHNYQRPDADYLDLNPQAGRLTGNAGYVRAGRVAGLWRYQGFVFWRSPGVDFNGLGYMQVADFISPGFLVRYYDATAGALLRRRDLQLKFTEPRDFGGARLGRNVTLEGEFATMGGAYLWARLDANTATLDPHVLRGGPALRIPDRYPLRFHFESDGSKPVQFQLTGFAMPTPERGSRDLYGEPGVVWKFGGRLRTALSFAYEHNVQPTQYAGTTTGAAPEFLVGHLDQRLLSATLKVTMNFNPTLSLSYYGGPFATTGRYDSFKVVTNPQAASAADRFAAVALTDAGNGNLRGLYQGNEIEMARPDFDWREFKSNLVLRWEYKAGSSLYCVWSQYRSDAADIGGFAPGPQYRQLFSAPADNTFLVKLSYWFSL